MSTKKKNDEPIVLDQALSRSEAFVLKYKTIILAVIAVIVVILVVAAIFAALSLI